MIGSVLVYIQSEGPLTPSPDEADSLLRRELLRPEYHDQNLLEQFMRWLGRQFESGLDRAASASPIGTLGTLVVFALVLVLLGWLVSRTRTSARTPYPTGSVLTAELASAAELRARATAALEAGDAAAAVIDGFRALTQHQIELGQLAEQPGATAHEVAAGLGAIFGDHRTHIEQAADLFDLVLYGDRPATLDQAAGILALDAALVPAR